jgi:hypothetical protein
MKCKILSSQVTGLIFAFQVCDYCDPSQPDKRHPAQFAVDGAETWWQSPPLSRGVKYNEVNLTIDLGQVSSTKARLPLLLCSPTSNYDFLELIRLTLRIFGLTLEIRISGFAPYRNGARNRKS